MIRHSIKLEGEAARGARISARVLSTLLDTLIEATQRSLRLRVEGRSHLQGKTDWLDAATDFELVGLDKGSTVLELETRSLEESVPDVLKRLPPWDNLPHPGQSAFDLFQDTLRDAMIGNAESDLLDREILKSIIKFDALLGLGYTSCTLDGSIRTVQAVTITSEGLHSTKCLFAGAPSPRKTIVSGRLDQMKHSRRVFLLRLSTGILRGVLSSGDISAYRDLLGEKVVVEGEANFRPSGTVSFILAQSIRKATAQDALWEQMPRPSPHTLSDLKPRNPLPPGASGFDRIFGKWPGDETDEEIALALEEMS